MKDLKLFGRGIVLAFCFVIVYFFILRPCIESLCVTKTIPVLSSLIKGNKPLEFYLQKTDRLAVFVSVFLSFLFLIMRPLKRWTVLFFQEKDSAWNLAVFRIVLFSFVLFRYDKEKILWFSQLPSELMFPPFGCKFLLTHIPVNVSWAGGMFDVFFVSCIFALIGLFSRVSCWIAVLSGLYVLGIPQFYGKVDHSHQQILWFMAILGCSPCSDVLSISSIFKGMRQADRGLVSVSMDRSSRYGLPLRIIWFLIGMIYFFPGFWKFIRSQWHWAFSDNLRNMMFAKWFELSGWTPGFRIDHYPWVYQTTGLLTIIFELTFIVMILIPSLRWFAVAGGLAFHNMTNMFMRISFLPLQICYTSFVNWESVFKYCGKVLFKKDMYVLYDGNCKICRRTMAILQKFDIFQRIIYINALDHDQVKRFGLDRIDPVIMMQDMHAILGKKAWKGFEAYRAFAIRIPLFWPVWPLFWVWPVPWIGEKIYRRVADTRGCDIRKPQELTEIADRLPAKMMGVKLVGILLIVVNGFLGFAHQVKAWPFSCYPTFASVVERPEIAIITLIGVKNGKEEKIDVDHIKKWMAPQKYGGLIENIIRDRNDAQKNARLDKLLKVFQSMGVDTAQYDQVRFYKALVSTVPEQYTDAPISRELLLELDQTVE